MFFGILGGLVAALINSADYLFSARFLIYYKSPVRLLVFSSVLMMLISLPSAFFLVPFSTIPCLWKFLAETALASTFFLIGQGSFFAAMRFFEASRLSSLLGLKILVLSAIFMLSGNFLNLWQLLAVCIAAAAAVMFNWAGSKPVPWQGWALLLSTLVGFSLTDMVETSLVRQIHEYSSFSQLRSALATVPLLYSALGILLLPGLFFYKPDKDQLIKSFPHAILWLVSQVFLLSCYAAVLPVFGNVILATRGIFSVIAGAMLPLFGLAALDSRIPVKLWIRRIAAAVMMLGAIALYSWAAMSQ